MSILEIEYDDLKLWDAKDIVKLLKRLLILEAKKHGISQANILVSENITSPDGGEDGRIKWTGVQDATEFIPNKYTMFQCKTGDLGPTEFAEEMVKTNGSLKSKVQEVFENKGTYIIFINIDYVQSQIDLRINNMREKLRELKLPYSETAQIKIYSLSTIVSWVNNHISAAVFVLNKNGRSLPLGLQTLDEWGNIKEFKDFPFFPDVSRQSFIETIKSEINNPRQVIRLVGLSGLGKSRTVFEAFNGLSEYDSLRSDIVYLDLKDGSENVPSYVANWIRNGLSGILILDNCPLDIHKIVKVQVEKPNSQLSFVSIDSILDQGDDTLFFKMEKLDNECIRKMLEPQFKDIIPDLHRIVDFAEGYPLMAVLLARARLNEIPEMGSLKDDDLLKSLLKGAGCTTEDRMEALKAASIFENFGISDDYSDEYRFAAKEVARISESKFYEYIQEFKEAGIIETKGRFARVTPNPLAIRMCADWWKRKDPVEAYKLISLEKPGKLDDAICERLAKIDFLPEIKKLTENLCGIQAPFGQAEVILSEKGSRLFRYILEPNPIEAAKSLERIIDRLSDNEVYQIDSSVRRNLIFALEKIVFPKDSFLIGARILAKFACNENEKWGNNSTGIFTQLFSTFLSGTEAGPELRIQLFDWLINKKEQSYKELAFKGFSRALSAQSGFRTGGSQYIGSGTPREDWKPKYWKDAWDYWKEIISRLLELGLKEKAHFPRIKEIIGKNIRSLIQRGGYEVLNPAIHTISENDNEIWIEALQEIKNTLYFDVDQMPEGSAAKLEYWLEILSPKGIRNEIMFYVSDALIESKKEGEEYINIAEIRSIKFAQKFIHNQEPLLENLDLLLKKDQKQAWSFGRELAQKIENPKEFAISSLDRIKNIDQEFDFSFLVSFLASLKERDASVWDEVFEFISQDNDLVKYYLILIRASKPGIGNLIKCVELAKEGKIPLHSLSFLAYGSTSSLLNSREMIELSKSIRTISDDGMWITFEIVFHYIYFKNEIDEELKDEVLSIIYSLEINIGANRNYFNLYEIVKRLEDAITEEGAYIIGYNILEAISSPKFTALIPEYLGKLFKRVFSKAKFRIWNKIEQILLSGDQLKIIQISFILGLSEFNHGFDLLLQLGENFLIDWCKKYPEIGPPILSRQSNSIEYIEGQPRLKKFLLDLLDIDEFHDKEKIISSIQASLGTFSAVGSVVPHYEIELKIYESLLEHKNPKVSERMKVLAESMKKVIEREKILDEEQNLW